MQKHKFWNREFVAALATTIFGRMGAGVMAARLALAAMTGCARVSTENVMMRGPGLPKPELIIVHDYEVSRDQVQLDSGPTQVLQKLIFPVYLMFVLRSIQLLCREVTRIWPK